MELDLWIDAEPFRLTDAPSDAGRARPPVAWALGALLRDAAALSRLRRALPGRRDDPRRMSDAELVALVRARVETGRWSIVRVGEAGPASRVPDRERQTESYADAIEPGALMLLAMGTDGVWSGHAMDMAKELGEALLSDAAENAGEWFDYQDDDWWGESMLSSAVAGAVTGLVYASDLVDGDNPQDKGLWAAVAGGVAGGLGAFATSVGFEGWETILITGAGVLVGAATAFAVFVMMNEGPDDDADEYEIDEDYLLPYSGSQRCIQGNHGFISHFGSSEFAYDFGLPGGSPVLCAYPGEVVQVRNCYTGNLLFDDQPRANRVVIRQEGGVGLAGRGMGGGEGKLGHYLHHRQFSATVKVGMRVEAGHVLAKVGNVGTSLDNHIHFYVADSIGGASQPIKFLDRDLDRHEGIARTNVTYRSENVNRGIPEGFEYATGGMDFAEHDRLLDAGDTAFCSVDAHFDPDAE